MGRRNISRVLAVLAFAFGVLATLFVYAQDRIFDADAFAAMASSSLSEPSINEYLADRIAEQILVEIPDLAVAGSLVEDVTASTLRSSTAATIVEVSARDVHQTVFDENSDSVALEVSDLVITVTGAIEAVSPELAEQVPDDIEQTAVQVSSGDAFTDLVQIAETVDFLTVVFVVAAVASLLGVVLVEPDRWASLGRMGLVLGATGLLLVIAQAVGQGVVASYGSSDLEARALAGAWNVLLGDLETWGWVLVGVGAFLAGLAWSLLQATAVVADTARSVAELVLTRPQSRPGQAVRLLGLLAVSVWAIFDPLSLLTSLLRCAGFVVAILVVTELVQLSGLDERLAEASSRSTTTRSWRTAATTLALPAIVLVMLGGVAAVLLSADEPAAASGPTGCNGHLELCQRRLDQVSFATSHNSMSSAEDGFLLANHLIDMIAQLDRGFRGFMIDTWYGRRDDNGLIVTSTAQPDTSTLDPTALDAAERARERATASLGEEQVYLCHSLCEIGALPAAEELRTVRAWLDRNPGTVLVFIVQDATAPADTARAFEEAGLAELAFEHDEVAPLPTLDDMLDDGKRIFVMVEEDGSGVDWLHDGFSYVQETPFSFRQVSDFTCEENRGEGDNPLFVVNHFLTPALGRNGDINERSVLGPRLDQCRSERGLLPNLVSVDFAGVGDVVELVDELNGVEVNGVAG